MNEILKIFNPSWWMSESSNFLEIADAILFLLLAIPVAYLLVYALASLRKYKNPYPPAEVQHRFLVLYVVMENGQEVIESINHFLKTQLYPRDKFDIVVAASRLSEKDMADLLKLPVSVIVPDKEDCSKVYAIQQVMHRYRPQDYDAITLFNSDNKVVQNALELFNNAYYSGCDAIQAHRMPENLDTSIAVLNATSEEINNHLFRKAHTNMGFSSALIGSGMMFDFEMFCRIIPNLRGTDFTKAMELELLEENIYVEYMEEVICYCKEASDVSGFSQERQRWISAQVESTLRAMWQFPLSLIQGKWDLSEKLFQWLLPSRFLLIAYIIIGAVVMTMLNWPLSIKWYVLLAILFMTFIMALPEGKIAKLFSKAVWMVPVLIVTYAFSFFLRPFTKKKDTKK